MNRGERRSGLRLIRRTARAIERADHDPKLSLTKKRFGKKVSYRGG